MAALEFDFSTPDELNANMDRFFEQVSENFDKKDLVRLASTFAKNNNYKHADAVATYIHTQALANPTDRDWQKLDTDAKDVFNYLQDLGLYDDYTPEELAKRPLKN